MAGWYAHSINATQQFRRKNIWRKLREAIPVLYWLIKLVLGWRRLRCWIRAQSVAKGTVIMDVLDVLSRFTGIYYKGYVIGEMGNAFIC